jgi:probable HAF family extracellular repeat protein
MSVSLSVSARRRGSLVRTKEAGVIVAAVTLVTQVSLMLTITAGTAAVADAQDLSQPVAVDLGTLGGSASYAYAANESGIVAGYSLVAGDRSHHAFAWTLQSGMVDIGTLGGSNSYAAAISDEGVVYGLSDSRADPGQHVFSWTRATGIVDLGSLGPNSYVNAVNKNGTVVGYRITPDYTYHGFVWTRRGGLIDLGTLAGGISSYSNALAVSADGTVVGWSTIAGGSLHAFRWTRTQGMVDLGAIGGRESSSYAAAVSDAGTIVGTSSTSAVIPTARSHAFVWTRARGMVDLGTLGGDNSWARAVNADGLVAGVSYVGGSISNAFAWTEAGGMVNIGTLGGTESDVVTVNGNGVVAGGSWTAGNAAWRGFAWTRRDGTIELRPAAGFTGNSYVSALTASGLAVGSSCSIGPDGETCHATAWAGGRQLRYRQSSSSSFRRSSTRR